MSNKKVICHCAGVTEGDVRNAIQNGDNEMLKLKKTLNVATTCKHCVPRIQEILKEEGCASHNS